MLKGRRLSNYKVNYLLTLSKANYLEIGCYDGVTLCQIADSNPQKVIYGIDPFIADSNLGVEDGIFLTDQKNNLYENISNFNNIKFYELTSKKFIDSHTQIDFQNLNIDFVYIDGAHNYDCIVVDCHLAIQCIMNNSLNLGIVLFDDLHIPDVVEGMIYFENLLNSINIKFDKQGDFYIIKK